MPEDRNVSLDVATVCRLVRDGSLLSAVAGETASLLSDDRLVTAM
jgi:hypothetical protein